ncbi:hypothetical protein ACWD6I_10645 [Streptomyces sp. NPDC002454]
MRRPVPGAFVAKYFRTFDHWLDGGPLPYDFALVTVNPNAQGQQVVNAVGGQRPVLQR